MSKIAVLTEQWKFNRGRTLALLNRIRESDDVGEALAWQPGTGRAPIGWHLAHIAITEELFASERVVERPTDWAHLFDRFRGGSVANSDVPTAEELETLLAATRSNLVEVVEQFDESDLDRIPPPLAERGWSFGQALNVLAWHEAHHQGQAHAVLNLYLNRG